MQTIKELRAKLVEVEAERDRLIKAWSEADKLFTFHVNGGCHAEREVLRTKLRDAERLAAAVGDNGSTSTPAVLAALDAFRRTGQPPSGPAHGGIDCPNGCGGPATCFGTYEGQKHPTFGCDACCGHGNEDGNCQPIKPPSGPDEKERGE